MSLRLGTRLGVDEATAKIGAGGMGEVYRSRMGHRAMTALHGTPNNVSAQ